jgi:deoxycytidylate deaminase
MAEERKHYRPSWDDYFMAIVKIVAARGTCDRLYAGSVLVKDNRIIATGYNGSPPGLPHCNEVGHLLEEGKVGHQPQIQQCTANTVRAFTVQNILSPQGLKD